MEGGALVTRHLARLGHRRIALLGGPPGHIVLERITEGYRRVLTLKNIPFDPTLVRAAPSCDAAAGERDAGEILEIPDAPTALVVMGDWRACGAMRKLRRRGARVPEDVAVAVYLHSAWLDDACHIPMTGVAESHEALVDGVLSAFAAQESGRTTPDETVVANLTLTVRRSCGAVP